MQSLWHSYWSFNCPHALKMWQIFYLGFPSVQMYQKEHGKKRKRTSKEQSQLAASTALVYMLDCKDFRNRSWLADTHTKKKGQATNSKFQANDATFCNFLNSTFYVTQFWKLPSWLLAVKLQDKWNPGKNTVVPTVKNDQDCTGVSSKSLS